MANYSDLVKEFKNKGEGFDLIYNKIYNSLKYFVFGYVKDEDVAKDIVSQTMLIVHDNIHKYDDVLSEFNTWVFAIAKNNSLSHIKANKKFVSIDMTLKGDEGTTQFKDLLESPPQADFQKEKEIQKVFSKVFTKIKLDSISGKILYYKHVKNLSNVEILNKLNKKNLRLYEIMKKDCENSFDNINKYTDLCIKRDLFYQETVYDEGFIKNNLRKSYKFLRSHFKKSNLEQILN